MASQVVPGQQSAEVVQESPATAQHLPPWQSPLQQSACWSHDSWRMAQLAAPQRSATHFIEQQVAGEAQRS
jgi:hypothetical protein